MACRDRAGRRGTGRRTALKEKAKKKDKRREVVTEVATGTVYESRSRVSRKVSRSNVNGEYILCLAHVRHVDIEYDT